MELLSDQLLIAAGRIPNLDTLDLQKTGVKVDEKNFIKTDKCLETNVKGIFALGDIIGRYLFKHSANHEAKYVFNNLLHPDKVPVDYDAMPHAIFSSPQVAGVGFKEQELMKEDIHYQKSVYPYMNTAMGMALEDRRFRQVPCREGHSKDSWLSYNWKPSVHSYTRSLSCHKAGRQERSTIDNIINTVHIYPALSEVVARAANNLKDQDY